MKTNRYKGYNDIYDQWMKAMRLIEKYLIDTSTGYIPQDLNPEIKKNKEK